MNWNTTIWAPSNKDDHRLYVQQRKKGVPLLLSKNTQLIGGRQGFFHPAGQRYPIYWLHIGDDRDLWMLGTRNLTIVAEFKVGDGAWWEYVRQVPEDLPQGMQKHYSRFLRGILRMFHRVCTPVKCT